MYATESALKEVEDSQLQRKELTKSLLQLIWAKQDEHNYTRTIDKLYKCLSRLNDKKIQSYTSMKQMGPAALKELNETPNLFFKCIKCIKTFEIIKGKGSIRVKSSRKGEFRNESPFFSFGISKAKSQLKIFSMGVEIGTLELKRTKIEENRLKKQAKVDKAQEKIKFNKASEANKVSCNSLNKLVCKVLTSFNRSPKNIAEIGKEMALDKFPSKSTIKRHRGYKILTRENFAGEINVFECASDENNYYHTVIFSNGDRSILLLHESNHDGVYIVKLNSEQVMQCLNNANNNLINITNIKGLQLKDVSGGLIASELKKWARPEKIGDRGFFNQRELKIQKINSWNPF